MSKNLEEEYRKMIAQETPDLWNRIESGLPRKGKGNMRVFRSSYLRFAAGAAAAIVIMCAAIPLAGTGVRRNETTEMPVDGPEWAESSKAPDAGAGNKAAPENFPGKEDAALPEDQEQESPTEINFGSGGGSGALEGPEDVQTEEPEGGEESVEVMEGEAGMDDFPETGILTASAETVHEDVPVSVTSARIVNGEKTYTAKVLKDTVTGLRKGDELVLKGDDIEKTLKEGTEYSVSFVSETLAFSQTVSENQSEIYSINKAEENRETEE